MRRRLSAGNVAGPADLERQLREMNEALLVSSVEQQELAAQADRSRDAAIESLGIAETARDEAIELRTIADAALHDAEDARDEANMARGESDLARKRLDRQNEAFQTAIRGAPLEESLAILARIVTDMDPAGQDARFGFHIADREGGCLHPIRVRGAGAVPDSYMDAADNFPIGENSLGCGIALATGAAIITPDVCEDALWKEKGFLPLAQAHGWRAYWSFPISTPDLLPVGTFYRYFAEPREPTQDDLAGTTMVTEAAAILISRHSLAQQRAQAEEALRVREQRHAAMLSSAIDSLITMDHEGRIVEFNPAAEQTFGWTREEIVGRAVADTIIPVRLRPAHLHGLERYLRTGEERVIGRLIEMPALRSDGTEFPAEISIAAIAPDGGAPFFTAFVRDITERKRAEEANSKLAAIVTSSDDAIISKDIDGIITSWNGGAEHLFGYTAEEALGKHFTLLIPEDHLEEEPQIIDRIRRSELVEHYETVRRRKDGSRLNISLTVSPIKDERGRVVGASKVARDITYRVEMENQIRAQALELTDLHRRKDEFLAMLSHELRNPLAPILNAIRLLELQKHDETPVQTQAREMIDRQVKHLKRLVDDLLEVSRIATGRVHLHMENLDFGEVVAASAEAMRPAMEAKGLQFTVIVSPDPVWLHADAVRLDQILLNLLTNAAKYSDSGGHVVLTARQEEDEAVIRVSDTGIGIGPELLPRIFDLFTQAEKALDRSGGGLGIGLALVKYLTELQGGTVEARSTVNKGSEFVVRLPLAAVAVTESASERTSTAQPSPSSRRIMIVEDNKDTADSLGYLLKLSGHEVLVKYEGHTALESAEQFVPDVVLLDIGLPGKTGYEVAETLRGSQKLSKSVLVAITGYGQEEDRQASSHAGFDFHLVKPVDFRNIQEILESVHATVS